MTQSPGGCMRRHWLHRVVQLRRGYSAVRGFRFHPRDYPSVPSGRRCHRATRNEGVRVRYKRKRFDSYTSRSAPFAHIRGRQTPAEQIGTGLREALRTVTTDLRRLELRWPGLAWGPVDVNVSVQDEQAIATLTDVNGARLTIGPISPSA